MNISVDIDMMNSHLPAILEINVKHFSFQFPLSLPIKASIHVQGDINI